MQVVLAAEAEEDLRSIARYIAKDNPSRALSFARELREAGRALGEWPERFPLVAWISQLGVRRRGHGNYGIYYRVEADRVVILRFVHGARDAEAMFEQA